MNLTARINNDRVEIFDVQTGGIHASHNLPPGEYSGPTISGKVVSVIIKTPYTGDKIRTIDLQTGSMISEISM
jgi:hypothetical protein